MEEMLIHILEQSVKKNGEIPLTNKHLLNILKMAERNLREDVGADIGDDPNAMDYITER